VARRAYDHFLQRGGASNDALADWYAAEAELGIVHHWHG
jgi:hypothetical protein